MNRKPKRKQRASGALPARVHSVPVEAPDDLAPAETLAEAEGELGVNDWIDPETGEPPEGQSPPHLDEE